MSTKTLNWLTLTVRKDGAPASARRPASWRTGSEREIQITTGRLCHSIVYQFCFGFASSGDENSERTATQFLIEALDHRVGGLDRGGAVGDLHHDLGAGHDRHREGLAIELAVDDDDAG